MSYLDLRNEEGVCPRCNEDADCCYCHLILCWEGDQLLEGADDNMDRLINWGCDLAIGGAPPRFDGPVLRELPIRLAKAMESQFLTVASMPELSYWTLEEIRDDPPYAMGACRKFIYAAWVEVAAFGIGNKRLLTDGVGTSGIYDDIEVENPVETLARMSSILLPATVALQDLVKTTTES